MRTTKDLQSTLSRAGPHDFLSIDAHLSAEEKRVRAEVRSFAEEKIRPNIKCWRRHKRRLQAADKTSRTTIRQACNMGKGAARWKVATRPVGR